MGDRKLLLSRMLSTEIVAALTSNKNETEKKEDGDPSCTIRITGGPTKRIDKLVLAGLDTTLLDACSKIEVKSGSHVLLSEPGFQPLLSRSKPVMSHASSQVCGGYKLYSLALDHLFDVCSFKRNYEIVNNILSQPGTSLDFVIVSRTGIHRNLNMLVTYVMNDG